MMRLLSASLVLAFPLLATAQGLTPEQSIKAMKLPEGFSVQCVAHEPMIRQPVSISFDEKGRMWVLQYLQYPNYEGLKPLKQDQYLRTIWDKLPDPPPKGPKGADKITILWDVGEDGKYRQSKDFVTGLNIASGFCIGNGGVYVAQPPYLLFYPDKNKDDVPDGDPEVLLTGFGMDDTHSLANSLQWGPDGWLYGAAGSTSTSKIPNPANPKQVVEFQQGVWRYHPATKRFEMFSEGGGNTYGLDFDRFGRCITGTNFGGKAMLHQMQGAYYVKGFSKHGPLHNPHAYGYFDHVPYEGEFKGGHVTCGGIVYDADLFPKEYRHHYIAANVLSNAIYMHTMTEKGSSFTAKHGADLLVSSDPWFRPVDCLLGPDGCVYVADFYDKRAAHLDPIDNWDKSNGRIYRISYQGAKPIPEMDLSKKSAKELVEMLKEPNKWWRNEARQLLAERLEEGTLENLVDLRRNAETSQVELEALWASSQVSHSKARQEANLLRSLRDPDPHIRRWAIRLIGDETFNSALVLGGLQYIAEKDRDIGVLCQLASSTRRFTPTNGVDILFRLLKRSEFENDPYFPQLIWWGIESNYTADHSVLLDHFRQNAPHEHWAGPIFCGHILERLAQRLMSEKDYLGCSELFERVFIYPKLRSSFFRGIESALVGQRKVDVPKLPISSILYYLNKNDFPPETLRFACRIGVPGAIEKIHTIIRDSNLSDQEKNTWILFLGEIRDPASELLLLDLITKLSGDRLSTPQPQAEQTTILTALQRFDSTRVQNTVLDNYPKFHGESRNRARILLLSRPASAKLLLEQIDTNKLPKTELTPDQLRPLIEFKDESLTKLIEKHYGKIAAATPGEKLARISWLNIQIPKGKADLGKGKELFAKNCAVCHQLFGEGGKIGPDLTTSDRKNRTYLLTHIVDPSLYIRPEYVTFNVNTFDGRRLSGVVTEQGESITLTNVVNNVEQKTTLTKKEIEEMKPSAVSLMPEKLLDTISEDDVRNLFGFLQSEPKKETPAKKDATKKLNVLLISGSLEYESDASLAKLQAFLEEKYPIQCSRAFRKTDNDIPGLDQLDKCDVAIFFTRRLTIEGEQLERVKKYLASGKPVIGIRTASHGFQKYLDMDKEIFGGSYNGHHGKELKCEVQVVEERKKHLVLKGVESYISHGSLYKNADIAKDCTVLMTGGIDKFTYPVTWIREIKGQRIFYTSLGHQDDFKEEGFLKLLANAIEWTTGK